MDNTPRVFAGRYEVGELIGRGGMAEVHIGHDARLGRTVAIKVLRSDLARDPSFLARFRREAQAAAALNHPAIVAVYDTGEDVHTDPATGNQVHIPFIVMEYVEGHTVRDILHDGAAVPIEEAVEITVGVLSALEYSHHAGIVHRDIKPANVMITPTGAVKVMDFGIARAVADSAATMTQTHAVIGTAQYLSPEQARGEQVDARSDLYSTGCLLFELLTGRPPFVGDSPVAVAYQHVGQAPQRPSEIASDVPEVLDRVTLKALAKERGARYSSAAEFRSDLETAMRGGAIAAPAIGGLAPVGAGAPTMAYGATGYGDPAGTQVLSPAQAPAPWGQTAAMPPASPPGGSPLPTRSEQNRDDDRRRKVLLWVLVSVAVLAVAAIVWALLAQNRDNAQPEMVTVPTLQSDVTRAEAEQKIEDAGLKFSDQVDPDSDLPRDAFVRQDPEGGREVAKGSTVNVFFSDGPNTLGVPDVTGLSLDDAKQKIEDADLKVGDVKTESSADVAEDHVTKTDPPAKQAVQSGDTIDLFVSDGTVELGNLVGMTSEDAQAKLKDLGLTGILREEQRSDVEPGKVAAQDPSPGKVQQKSQVHLVIATEETVTVPDVAGRPWNDDTQAEFPPLNADEKDEASNDVPPGVVIRTEPGPGNELKAGDHVTVFVSTGPADVGAGSPTPTDQPTGGQ